MAKIIIIIIIIIIIRESFYTLRSPVLGETLPSLEKGLLVTGGG